MTTDDELRQRIVDAAAELFAENGYGGTKPGETARLCHDPYDFSWALTKEVIRRRASCAAAPTPLAPTSTACSSTTQP